MIKCKLGDLIEFQRGYDLPKSKANGGKYKIISSNGILAYHNQYKSEASVVIGRSGTVGKPQLIQEKFWPHNTTLFVKDFKDNNIIYIYYLLLNMNIEKMKSGSNIPTLNRNHLHPLEIVAEESIYKQQKIANILKIIDDKINNNNKINTELEAMAKTVYDYWFLQYEYPNEEGKPYKSSGGKMVWNDELKKEIPEGWKVENLLKNSLTKIITPGVEYFIKKNYLATANVDNDEINDGNWISFDNRESRANMQPSKNSIWIAKMKKSVKHITIPENAEWFINKYILSTGFLGLQCSKNTLSYLHCFINSAYFELKKDSLAHGATQEAINNSDVKFVKILIPTNKVLSNFDKIIYPILEQKSNLQKENQELIGLRDYLLPLLMNGQVGFKN